MPPAGSGEQVVMYGLISKVQAVALFMVLVLGLLVTANIIGSDRQTP
jgi:hypothetical protein